MLFPRALIDTDEPQKLKTLTHSHTSQRLVYTARIGRCEEGRNSEVGGRRKAIRYFRQKNVWRAYPIAGTGSSFLINYFRQKNSHRSDSCLRSHLCPLPPPYGLQANAAAPAHTVPEPEARLPPASQPLSHRCRTSTRHLCVNSASPLPPPPPPPPPPSRRRRHERGVVGRGGGGPVARHEHVVVAGPEEEADRELAPARAGVRLPRLGAQALGPTDDVPG